MNNMGSNIFMSQIIILHGDLELYKVARIKFNFVTIDISVTEKNIDLFEWILINECIENMKFSINIDLIMLVKLLSNKVLLDKLLLLRVNINSPDVS